jgi:hypothetical protein
MEWVELGQDNRIVSHLPEIWQREQAAPRWFQAASLVWTADFAEFEAWVLDCAEVYGLFDNENNLVAVVYVEAQTSPFMMTVHLSVLERSNDLIKPLKRLRDSFLRRGVKRIRGWVMMKNLPLLALLKEIGFLPCELFLDCGSSHGKILRWQLMEICAG